MTAREGQSHFKRQLTGLAIDSAHLSVYLCNRIATTPKQTSLNAWEFPLKPLQGTQRLRGHSIPPYLQGQVEGCTRLAPISVGIVSQAADDFNQSMAGKDDPG